MEHIKTYILSLLSASVLCSILISVAGKGKTGAYVKLVCGSFIALCLLRPLTFLKDLPIPDLSLTDYGQGEDAALFGQEYTSEQLKQYISERVEAYILDRAASLGAALEVKVGVSDDEIPIPVEIIVSGDVSSDIRSQLEEFIETDLGITKEAQFWIG